MKTLRFAYHLVTLLAYHYIQKEQYLFQRDNDGIEFHVNGNYSLHQTLIHLQHMHESFDWWKSLLDDVGNKMELCLQHKNYFHHQSQYQVHLVQKQVHRQNHVLLLDLQCMHLIIHVQYVLQLDERCNDIDVVLLVLHKIRK